MIKYIIQVHCITDKRVDTTTEVDGPGGQRAKRYNVLSRIKLQPTAEDDYADYTCEARHEALPPDMPLRVTVQLSVFCKFNNVLYEYSHKLISAGYHCKFTVTSIYLEESRVWKHPGLFLCVIT